MNWSCDMTVFVLEWIIMEETRDDKCDRILKTMYSNIRAKLNVNKLFVLILKFLFIWIWLWKGNDEEEELFGSR